MAVDLIFIQDTLDRKVDPTDRPELEKKLNDCIELLGISAKLKSQAYKRLFKRKEALMFENEGMKTSLLRMVVDAGTAEENGEYLYAERLNVSLSKAIDGLKAVLNITKEESSVKW